MVSLYFLHLGFRLASSLFLSLGGIAAGLCLASSISGKQYLLALVIAATIVRCVSLEKLNATSYMEVAGISLLRFCSGCHANPLLHLVQSRERTLITNRPLFSDFWRAMRISPFPVGIRPYTKQLFDCFFTVPAFAFLFPILCQFRCHTIGFYCPACVLALWQKRFEIVLLATIPVAWRLYCYLLRKSPASSNPILGHLNEFHVCGAVEASTMAGRADCFLCHVRIDIATWTSPVDSIHLRQNEESVFDSPLCAGGGRCLPLLETCCSRPGTSRPSSAGTRRVQPDSRNSRAPYETLICQNNAYSIIHLFLHDYDDAKILSFCAGYPFFWVMTEQEVWNANKSADSQLRAGR